MEMGVNEDSPWKEAKLFVNDKEITWGEPIALFRGEESEVRVEVPSSIEGALSLGLVNDDALTVGADPAFNDWVPGSDGKFTWKLIPDAGTSGRVQLVVLSREVDEFWTLPCWVISSSLADEVEEIVVADYVSPSAPDIFFRNDPRTVNVTYKPGSPLSGYPLELTGSVLTGTPVLSVDPSGAHTWTVKASTGSGTFRLALTGAGMSAGIDLPISKVLSRNLDDEVELYIGENLPPPGEIEFTRNTDPKVELRARANSPINGYPLASNWSPGDLLPGDVISDPPFWQVTTNHSWILTIGNKSGKFELIIKGRYDDGDFHSPLRVPCRII
jgi:hypothetical protein